MTRRTHAQIRAEGWEAGRKLAIAETIAKLNALGHAKAAHDLAEAMSSKQPVVRYSGYDITTSE